MSDTLTPEKIMKLGMAFWGSKTLMSAVELELFTVLAQSPLDGERLRNRLGLHSRGARDFFDALVSLGMIERKDELYRNTPESNQFLDKAKPSYIGGFLDMANNRLYPYWGSLTEALRTGQPQNEIKKGGSLFDALYNDPVKLRSFLQAMTGISMGASKAIAQKFPWQSYHSFIDIGCAQGGLPVQIALAHSHLTGGGFDLPIVKPIFEEYVASCELNDRLRFHPGRFLQRKTSQSRCINYGAYFARLEFRGKETTAFKSL